MTPEVEAREVAVQKVFSAPLSTNKKDLESAYRHFIFPAIVGGVDAAIELLTPMADTLIAGGVPVLPAPGVVVGVVLRATIIAGGSAVLRYIHRWWIDLRKKVEQTSDDGGGQ